MQCVAYDRTFSRDIEERYYSRLKLERQEAKLKKQISAKSTTTTTASAVSSSIQDEADASDSVFNSSESSYMSPSSSPRPDPPLRRSQRQKVIRSRWRVQSSRGSEDEEDIDGFGDGRGSDDGNATDGGLSYVDSD